MIKVSAQTVSKRLCEELAELRSALGLVISVGPKDGTDFHDWEGLMYGPENTPYSCGVFRFRIAIPESYPFEPPNVYFLTQIFHPNIAFNTWNNTSHTNLFCGSDEGFVSIAITEPDKWTPSNTITDVMACVVSLLFTPDDESPLNLEAMKLYASDKNAFSKKAKKLTAMFSRAEILSQ